MALARCDEADLRTSQRRVPLLAQEKGMRVPAAEQQQARYACSPARKR